MRAGDRLREWLEELVHKTEPGYKLPTDNELAVAYGVSPRTLRRAMSQLKERGLVERVSGKGTYKANTGPPPPLPPHSPQRSSVDRLVTALKQSISRGEIRRGTQLPQTKYICHQYQVSEKTVTAAYRRLEKEDLVCKIGKQYWVGRFLLSTRTKSRSEVYITTHSEKSFRQLFVDYPIAISYRRLESELTQCGVRLKFATFNQLVDAIPAWTRKKSYPLGILLARCVAGDINRLHPFLGPIMRKATRSSGVTVVAESLQVPPNHRLPNGMTGTFDGNLATAQARSIGEYLTRMPERDVVFLTDGYTLMNNPRKAIMRYFKHAYEILNRRTAQGGAIYHTVVGGPAKLTRGWLLEEALGNQAEYTNYLHSKYKNPQRACKEDLDSSIEVFRSIDDVVEAHGRNAAWLLIHDALADSAISSLARWNRKVPRDVAIISLENTPHHLHLGITSCAPDWDLMGYLLAHALLDDTQLEYTRLGFIRIASPVVERQTTPL